MQHAKVLFSFVVVVFTKAFLIALFSGRLVRLIVRDWVVQCRLQTLAAIVKVFQGSSRRFEILNLHLPLPLDGDSKL